MGEKAHEDEENSVSGDDGRPAPRWRLLRRHGTLDGVWLSPAPPGQMN